MDVDSQQFFVSLRDFFEDRFRTWDERFRCMERELANLRSAFETMSRDMVTMVQFEGMRAQVREQDKRLDKAEEMLRVLRWLGGIVVAILVAVGVAWIKRVLGL